MKKRAAFPAVPAVVALFALYLFLPGCGSRPHSPLTGDLTSRCIVIADDQAPAGWTRWLDEHMEKSPRYQRQQIGSALAAGLKDDAIVIMPGFALRADDEPALDDYLARGGRLLLLGYDHAAEKTDHPRIRQATGAGLGSYTFTSTVFRLHAGSEPREFPPVRIAGMYPPAPVNGGSEEIAGRLIPVWEAAGSHGITAGWAGSILLIPQADAGYSVCGRLAFDPPDTADRQLEEIMAQMIIEAGRTVYLARFSIGAFSFRQQKPVLAVAQIIDRRTRDFSPLRLAARWIDRNGQEIRRHVSEPLDSPSIRTELPVGVAPEPFSRQPELFTLELQIRDRNDLETLDSETQAIKVFPAKNESARLEPVTASGNTLVAGRRPVFILGVNYWPRLAARTAGLSGSSHWLNAGRFDPDMLAADLDMLAAAGINSIAIEYTDISHAPQLLFVLDELRKRSLRASVYMPSLHPFDLRREEALAMLSAIEAADWPELFAVEVARGLGVRSRADLRRLDQAWSGWLDERFSSISEIEQRLGVSIWREHGHIAGPPDTQLSAGPDQDRAIALYYSFLHDYASRQIGYVKRMLASAGHAGLLVTARSAYGWPDSKPESLVDVLDIRAGAIHQDFLSPDAWTIHPLGQMNDDKSVLAAYVAGAGKGKPVLWSGYGQHTGTTASPADLERQKEVYLNYLTGFVELGASGALAWWYPGGISSYHREDWGIVEPQGAWRPVEEAIRSIRLQLRQGKVYRPVAARAEAPFNLSASQWLSRQNQRAAMFAGGINSNKITEWTLPGSGLDTRAIMKPGEPRGWSEIDGLHLLNSEWGSIMVDGARQDRQPGENVKTYTDRLLLLELINSGTVRWTSAGDKRDEGSVWIRITQPGHQEEWIPASSTGSGEKQQLAWTPRAPGLWQVQAYLIGYGKFGERIQVEATTPPRLY